MLNISIYNWSIAVDVWNVCGESPCVHLIPTRVASRNMNFFDYELLKIFIDSNGSHDLQRTVNKNSNVLKSPVFVTS